MFAATTNVTKCTPTKTKGLPDVPCKCKCGKRPTHVLRSKVGLRPTHCLRCAQQNTQRFALSYRKCGKCERRALPELSSEVAKEEEDNTKTTGWEKQPATLLGKGGWRLNPYLCPKHFCDLVKKKFPRAVKFCAQLSDTKTVIETIEAEIATQLGSVMPNDQEVSRLYDILRRVHAERQRLIEDVTKHILAAENEV